MSREGRWYVLNREPFASDISDWIAAVVVLTDREQIQSAGEICRRWNKTAELESQKELKTP